MLVNLRSYPESAGASTAIEVEPNATVEDLINLYRVQRFVPLEERLVILSDKGKSLPENETLEKLRIVDGHTLRIGFKDQIFPKKKSKIMVGIVFVCIVIVIIIALSLYFALHSKKQKNSKKALVAAEGTLLMFRRKKSLWCENAKNYTKKYGIVMDGGSTKTCSVSYSWNGNRYKGTGCVTEENMCCAKGGLTSADPVNHIKRVMVCVKKLINGTDQRTPIYFGATASMRIKNILNANEAKYALDQMKEYLQKADLLVRDVDIVSGEDEGLYRWIAANYMRGIFKDNNFEEVRTYGSMHLGEASTEIAFEELTDKQKENPLESKSVELYGKKYNTVSRSYLCFGRETAEERYRSFLIQDVAETNVEDPCSPSDFTYKKSGVELFYGICTHNSRFTDAMKKQPDVMKNVYRFKGTGNPLHCRGNVSKIMDEEECKRLAFRECFKKIKVPENEIFLAYSGFYFAAKLLNATQSSLKAFVESADQVCRQDIHSINKNTDVPKKYRTQFCFDVQYVRELLTSGYGFSKATWKNIQFVGEINKDDVTWTMGYMINATNDPTLN